MQVTITYLDEDADTITISSNDELAEAFEQFVNKSPPIVRATATFIHPGMAQLVSPVVDHANGNDNGNGNGNGNGKGKGCHQKKRMMMMNLRERVSQLETQFARISSPTSTSTGTATGTGTTVAPTVTVEKQERHIPKEEEPNNDKVHLDKPESTAAETAPTDEFASFDPNFIHGRHTCDSCFTTPITGYRFHAANLPDYDLCHKCVKNYKGKDVIFQPEQLDRDQHLQRRWQARKMRCNNNTKATGVQTPAGVGPCHGFQMRKHASKGFCDAALNEAIRRSLVTEKRSSILEEIKNNQAKDQAAVQTQTQSETEDKCTQATESDSEADTVTVAHLVAVDEKSDAPALAGEVKDATVFPGADADADADAKDSEVEPEVEVEVSPVLSFFANIDSLVLEIQTPQLEESSTTNEGEGQGDLSQAGAKIVDGDDDDAMEIESQASANDWEVIDESGKVSNEMVAQAFELLGSALFQSDMACDNLTMPSESVSMGMSGLTSVPSITSEISPVLLNRWEEELRQLHELGFLDDHANVEGLGHLEAANMGVDSDDPITVNAVVNYLLNKKHA